MPSRESNDAAVSTQLERLGLLDLEQVRLVLEGTSIVDWRQLSMGDFEQVNGFLERVGLHMDDSLDVARLNRIYSQALGYVEAYAPEALPSEVRSVGDVRELFILASRPGPTRPHACMMLKVMHIIHHVAGRELLYRLPVPISDLFYRIERQMFGAFDGMKQAGINIVELGASRKAEHSVITKLLCRRDSQAAQIHDRLRFRVVTESLDDILEVLVYLCRHVIPFNYVVPGESRNGLIDLDATIAADPNLAALAPLLQDLTVNHDVVGPVNHFTASNYRDVNFVVDMAVRVDEWVEQIADYSYSNSGQVVFLLTEFQVVSQDAHRRNNEGDSRHDLYKKRQRERAFRRLLGDFSS